MSVNQVFYEGEPVVDAQDHHETGRVEFIRADGRLNIRWASGRTEWVSMDDIELAPGYKRKPQQRKR